MSDIMFYSRGICVGATKPLGSPSGSHLCGVARVWFERERERYEKIFYLIFYHRSFDCVPK